MIESDKPSLIGVILLVAVTTAAYIPVMTAGFIWDDNHWLWDNPPTVAEGSAGLKDIWSGDDPPDFLPLTSTIFWLQWRVWEKNATGYHLVNLAAHIVGCLLVWRVLWRLGIPGAPLAAIAFAVHPVGVASVAWITEHKNTFSLIFFALTILSYLKFDDIQSEEVRRNGTLDATAWVWLLASVVSFLIALLIKGSVVVLPAVLLLIVWWRRNRIAWPDVLFTFPFFVMAGFMSWVVIYYQREHAIGTAIIAPQDFTPPWPAAAWAWWFYALKALIPWNLAMLYERWTVDMASALTYLPTVALLGVITWLIVMWLRGKAWAKFWLFGVAYVVITLSPVLGFFKMFYFKFAFVADHWQYLALIGFCAMIACAIAWLRQWRDYRYESHSQALGILWIVALAVLTYRQASFYHDAETLWQANITHRPTAWKAHYNLGLAIKEIEDEKLETLAEGNDPGLEQARVLARERLLSESIKHLQRSAALRPDGDTFALMGQIYLTSGRPAQALPNYLRAAELNPNMPIRFNDIGASYHAMGQHEKAIEYFKQALAIDAAHGPANRNMALILHGLGRIDEAIPYYLAAIKDAPKDPELRRNAGALLASRGRPAEALPHMEALVELRPDDPSARSDLGVVLGQMGRTSDALIRFNEALRIDPESVSAMSNLGGALVSLGKYQEAVVPLEKAVQISPAFAKARYNLAIAFRHLNKPAEAIGHYREVLRSEPNWVDPLNELALLLATHPDDRWRDGEEAVALAERANQLVNLSRVDFLTTLGAAYAEVGRFDDAIKAGERARQMAQSVGRADVAEVIDRQLALYRQGKPLRGETP